MQKGTIMRIKEAFMDIRKGLLIRLTAVSALVFILSQASCLSTNKAVDTDDSQKFIYMYDNCPNETNARLALSAIRSSVKGYKGVTLYNIAVTPEEDSIQSVSDYYNYCRNIKTAITKGSKRLCNLSFNTEKDGTGITLDLSTKEARVDSLMKMIAFGKTELYAIYSY